MRAWLFQDHRQKQKLGNKAPWSVGWYDPDGKKRSKRIGSESMAKKFLRKVEGQLAAGTYESNNRKKWSEFRRDYEDKIGSGLAPSTQLATSIALDHFERIVKPAMVSTINTSTIDGYIAQRRTEKGMRRQSKVSPATINKELRHIKAVLNVAQEWGHLSKASKIRMLREPEKLPRFVTPEHFAAIYNACGVAHFPKNLPYPAADWWRAMIVFMYMTGWRISEPLALRGEDLDLEAGTAITRHADNKGKRDNIIALHPVVIEHLVKIKSFEPVVFPWYHGRPGLWVEFRRIQLAAGIHLDCHEKHEHADGCHVYGFHDLRRAFATVNAPSLSADELQGLMRHKSYQTTQRYINMASQLNKAVDKLHVPDLLRRAAK